MASDPTPIEPTSDETPKENGMSPEEAAGSAAAAAVAAAASASAAVSAAASAAPPADAVSKAATKVSAIETELAGEVAVAAEFKQEAAELKESAEARIKEGLGVRLSNSIKANPVKSGVIIGTVVLLIVGLFLNVPEPHVALGGEAINSQVPWWFTNSLLTTLIVDVILLLLAFGVFFSQKMVPSGLQNAMEAIIEYFWGLAEQISGKAAKTYFPWIMTIFLFVILSNWTGIIPGVGSVGWNQMHEEEHATSQEQVVDRMAGQLAMADGKLVLLTPDKVAAALPAVSAAEAEGGMVEHFIPLFRAPSADLNVTFAISLTVMTLVQIYGFRALGFSYLQKFFTLRGQGMMKGISAFVGILELISEISRILSFGFRLFGNIFAGEIVLATMAFLMAFVLPAPFYILEVFVGFVQALVFAMLALVFFTLSTHGHGDDHGHDEAHAGEHAQAAAAAH